MSWLISDPLIQTHSWIRVGDGILGAIQCEGDLTDWRRNRPERDLFVTGLTFATVKTSGQHPALWNKSVDDTTAHI